MKVLMKKCCIHLMKGLVNSMKHFIKTEFNETYFIDSMKSFTGRVPVTIFIKTMKKFITEVKTIPSVYETVS